MQTAMSDSTNIARVAPPLLLLSLLLASAATAAPRPAHRHSGPATVRARKPGGEVSRSGRPIVAADTLRGRVRTSAGAPLAGATVRLPEVGRSATTDDSGSFVLAGLPRGRYRVVVERLGYESTVRRLSTGDPAEMFLSTAALPAEPIVVTATGAAIDVRESPLPVSVVSRNELTATDAVSIAHTLEDLPGVRNLSTGQQVGKPVIRGLSGPRIAVRENGLPLEYLDWSDEDGPSVDARLADRMEVVRGPASVLYGSGAIGGVVNVLPEPLPGTPGGGSTLSGTVELYGSSGNAEGGAHVELQGASGPFGWRVSGVGRSGDNIETPDGELGNTGFRAINGRAAVGLQEEWGTLGLRYSRHRGEFELLEAGEEPREPLAAAIGARAAATGLPATQGAIEEIRSEDEGPLRELEDDRVQLASDLPLGPGVRIEVRGQFQRHWTAEIPPGAEEGGTEPVAEPQAGEEGEEYEFAFRLNTGSGRVLVHHTQGEHLSGTYGLSGQLNDTGSEGEIPIIPDGQRSSFGVFALEEFRLDPVRLFTGARFDAEQLEVVPAPELSVGGGERDYSAFTGSLGASVRAGAGLVITANVGRAWRAPTLLELHSDGPRIGEYRYEIGDPSMEPETSLNLDAGVRFERGAFRARLRGYRNEIDDFVFLEPTDEFRGDLRVHRYGQVDAHLIGMEASATVEPVPVLELGTRLEAVEGTNEETGAALPRMPPARGALGAELHRRDLSWAERTFVRVETEAVAEGEPALDEAAGGEPPAGEEGEREFGLETGSYALLHLTAGWEGRLAGRDVRVTLRVRNATDNDYRDFLSRYKEFALAPGRSLTLRLATDF